MDEDDFIETVRSNASLESTETAETVTEATLHTLGERITDGEAESLAGALPPDLAGPLLDAPGEAEPFPLETFVERVSDRTDVDDDARVRESVRGVAAALDEAAAEALASAREQLPPAYDACFEPGGATTEADFLEVVRRRADLGSTDAAAAATTATLRTLGERLTAGEAADLASHLPAPLGESLLETAEGDATAHSYDEFLARVSQREGAEKAVAERHARAVGSALAETVGEREFGAATAQLPDSYGRLFASPTDADEDGAEGESGR